MRALAVVLLLAAGCASTAPHASNSQPTDKLDRLPSVGCIWPSQRERSQVGGVMVDGKWYEAKRLPRIVRILGPYTDSDGFPLLDEQGDEQLRVLFPPEFDPRKWVPVKKSLVRFAGCGNEIRAYESLEFPQP